MAHFPEISADSAIVITADTGLEICSKAPTTLRAMASLTKIMTALIAVERSQLPLSNQWRRPLDGWATVGFYPLQIEDDDNLGFALGEEVRFIDLLYPMMLRSSADATRTVAEHVIGRTSSDLQEGESIRSEFVAVMNARALALGLGATHFRNASGYDPEDRDGCPSTDPFHDETNCGHHSSAEDLAKLTRLAMRNSTLAAIVRRRAWRFVSKAPLQKTYEVGNDLNAFYDSYPGMSGVKPGQSGNAGVCRVYSAGLLGKSVIAVTLKSAWDAGVSNTDNQVLLDHAFKMLFELHRKDTSSRDGVIHHPQITALSPNRIVTAVRDAEAHLTVAGWTVTSEGVITHVDSDRDQSTGTISEVACDTLGVDKVVTAVRDGDGKLRLMTWNASPSAQISRLDGQTLGPTARRIRVRALSPSRAVTILRNSDGVLALFSWHLNPDGSWTQLDQYPSSNHDRLYPAEQLGLTSYARNTDPDNAAAQTFRVITAVTDSADALKVISWNVDENGAISRHLESSSTAECVGEAAIAYQVAFEKERILTACRNRSGDLEVTTWRFQDGQIERLADSGQQAHAASEICLAGLAPGLLCTAVRTGAGNLKLITWRFARGGALTRFIDSGSEGGRVSQVAMCQLTGNSHVTAVKTSDGNLELTAWKVEAP